MVLLPPDYLDSVVAIGNKKKPEIKEFNSSEVIWSATGFFYGYCLEKIDEKSLYFTYLVTNKHVIDGVDEVILKLTLMSF